jgi:hypothetical protein
LVAAGGTLVLEIAPGAGERSRYLARLPSGSVARLLRSPLGAFLPRVAREGYREEPRRRPSPGEFRRLEPGELAERLATRGFAVREVMAVAPMLGADAERTSAVEADPKSWAHLLESEEKVGRLPERWPRAAAVLLAAERAPAASPEPGPPRTPKSEG